MKTKQKILDVDFIGEQLPLTQEEKKVISDFFKLKKKPELSQKIKTQKT